MNFHLMKCSSVATLTGGSCSQGYIHKKFYTFSTYLQNSWDLAYKVNSKISLSLNITSNSILYSKGTRGVRRGVKFNVFFSLTLCFASIPFHVLIRVYWFKGRYPQQWKSFFPKTKIFLFLKIAKTPLSWLPLETWSSIRSLDGDYLICCHRLSKFLWTALLWTIPAVLAAGIQMKLQSFMLHVFDPLTIWKNQQWTLTLASETEIRRKPVAIQLTNLGIFFLSSNITAKVRKTAGSKKYLAILLSGSCSRSNSKQNGIEFPICEVLLYFM